MISKENKGIQMEKEEIIAIGRWLHYVENPNQKYVSGINEFGNVIEYKIKFFKKINCISIHWQWTREIRNKNTIPVITYLPQKGKILKYTSNKVYTALICCKLQNSDKIR